MTRRVSVRGKVKGLRPEAEAKAKGDARKVKDAEDAIAAQKTWLDRHALSREQVRSIDDALLMREKFAHHMSFQAFLYSSSSEAGARVGSVCRTPATSTICAMRCSHRRTSS